MLLTRLLFDGRLPADMNVFDAVGSVLPPCSDGELLYKHKLCTPSAELVQIKEALEPLAGEEHLLAEAFLPICDNAIAIMREKEQTTTIRTDREEFDG